VTTASDAASALAAFDSFRPEVVVTDLRLPRTEDGLKLIRDLRNRDAQVRILVLTGWPADFFELPESRLVDQFLRKPVRSGQLLRLIDRVA
jgi:DNA-binding response OmpR family regulator